MICIRSTVNMRHLRFSVFRPLMTKVHCNSAELSTRTYISIAGIYGSTRSIQSRQPHALRLFSNTSSVCDSASKGPDNAIRREGSETRESSLSASSSSPSSPDPSPSPSPKRDPKKPSAMSSIAPKLSANLSALGSSVLARENIWNVPNILTFTRLAASPVIGYWVVNGQTAWALSLFVYSCITDMLDGLIARRYNMKTVVGSVIDPLADKALMITLASCLAVSGDIPLYIGVIILGRDVLLGISAVYYRYISLPPPKTLLRYWDFSIPSAEVHPTQISKINTVLQMLYLGSSLVFPAAQSYFSSVELLDASSLALQYFGYVVATTTVLSGLSYVFSKDAVTILTKKQKPKSDS